MDNEELFTVIENRLYHLKPPYPLLPLPPLPSSSSSSPSVTSSSPSPPELQLPAVILLNIHPIGSWIIKFHKSTIIINDSDLIFQNLLTFHSSITFHSVEAFWATIQPSSTPAPPRNLEDEIKSRNDISFNGTWDYIYALITLLGESTSGRYHSTDGGRRYSFSASLPISNKKKSTKDKVNEGIKSIKSGWFYKKRDIIAGWRQRYFKLYLGRIEYYTDPTAVVPRGIIPLFGAEVIGPKVCSVNGEDDHWSITVEPKHRDKSFKIASEKGGIEGKAEVESWIQAIRESARLGDPLSASFTYNSTEISPRKRSGSVSSNRASPHPSASGNFFTSPSSSTASISMDRSSSPPPSSTNPHASTSVLSKTKTNVQKKIRRLTSTFTSQESLEELQRQKHLVLLFLLLLLLGIGLGGFYWHTLKNSTPVELTTADDDATGGEPLPPSLLLPSSIILTLSGALCCGLLLLFYLTRHAAKGSREQEGEKVE